MNNQTRISDSSLPEYSFLLHIAISIKIPGQGYFEYSAALFSLVYAFKKTWDWARPRSKLRGIPFPTRFDSLSEIAWTILVLLPWRASRYTIQMMTEATDEYTLVDMLIHPRLSIG
jgi:hypothetical protein